MVVGFHVHTSLRSCLKLASLLNAYSRFASGAEGRAVGTFDTFLLMTLPQNKKGFTKLLVAWNYPLNVSYVAFTRREH